MTDQLPSRQLDSAELSLRLANVMDVLETIKTDDDGEISEDYTGGILSALDYAVRGDPGCIEPDEWAERRQRSLSAYREYLGL